MKYKDSFRVDIDLSNNAFQGMRGRVELAAILESLAARVRNAPDWRTNYPTLQDNNGNTCGQATITDSGKEDDNTAEALYDALLVILLGTARATIEDLDPEAVRQAVKAVQDYEAKQKG